MADIAKSGTPSLATLTPPRNCQPYTGAIAGEALAAGDIVYLKASDGRWYKTVGSADAAAAEYRGVIATAASAGEACTPFIGVAMRYGSGLTPGALIYLSTDTAGGLADANATVTKPVAVVVAGDRIQVFDPFDSRTVHAAG